MASDPCADGGLLSVDEAVALMLDAAAPVSERETLPLREIAGRVLAEDCRSAIDVPGYDNSAMDGYAVRAADIVEPGIELPVSQRIAAGQTGGPLQPGAAARIFTGAPLPEGADAVVMQERCEARGDAVRVNTLVAPGANVRRAGEDITAGRVLLEKGMCIRPQEAGLLASVGMASVPVFRKLRVAVFFTGDELVEPGSRLQPGQIYNSNQYTLTAMLEQLGCEVEVYGIVEDTLEATLGVLREASANADLVITSGGVSVGEEDYVRIALEELGELSLWRIAMKPGKPVAFGRIGSTVFMGLPGNPVAVFVTGLVFAAPVIRKMQGCNQVSPPRIKVRADFEWPEVVRQEFVRARLVNRGDASYVEIYPHQGSGVLSSVSWAHGLVDIPVGKAINTGDIVDFLPFEGLPG